jgi:DNA-binding MarR family transcriptional regulator
LISETIIALLTFCVVAVSTHPSVEAAVASFFRATRRARGRAAQRTEPGELSLAQFQVLEPLLDGACHSGALAEQGGVTAPTATRMIDGLVTRGIVVREPDPTDRRAVLVSLTPEGKRAMKAKLAKVSAARKSIAAAFADDEQELVADILQRLADAVEEL